MSGIVTASRFHDISVGHRVYGHESACAHLHGHNYRVHFTVVGDFDAIGRVLDFSVIKTKLCMWLEDNWDHKFLVWKEDPWGDTLLDLDPEGLVGVDFNPTAENMAKFLVEVIGPKQLEGTGCVLSDVTVEETRKCSATFSLKGK